MPRSKIIPAVLLLVILSVFAGAVLATGGTPGGNDEGEVKEDAVKAMLDSEGKVINPNRRMAQVASGHEGGFGGWYFSDDKDTVYVFMKDTTKTEAARGAFEAAYSGQHTPTNVVVIAGSYSLDDLAGWLHQVVGRLADEGIYFRTAGVDQGNNVVQIGLSEAAHIETAKRIMGELGIPAGAVELVQKDGGRLLGGRNSQPPFTPPRGR